MRPSSDRIARLGLAPSRRDVAVAAVVAVLAGAFAGTNSAMHGVGMPAVTAGLVAAEAIPLAWRRRGPVAVLAATLALAFIVAVVPAAAFTPLAAAAVATYTVAARRSWRVALACGGGTAVGAPVVMRTLLEAAYPYYVTVVPADHLANDLAGSLVVFGGLTALGATLRARRAHTARVEEHAARVERERAEREQRAVLEERTRIARELHDVAAHHLSGLVLQAGALERTATHHPERVRDLAAEVREGGATALASMRRLVGLLRSTDDEAGARGSQPTLADLRGLVDRARSDGLDVQLTTDAHATGDGAVPDEVGLAAYRIVQEALSNTRRHAPGARTGVRIARHDDRLEVEVVDDGGRAAGPPAGGDEHGHGLIGMRERVALLDGTLEAGPLHPRGWRVRTELPLDGREPA